MDNFFAFVWGLSIFLFYLMIIAFVVVVIGAIFIGHLKHLEQKWLPWKKFAEQNKLRFYPASLFLGAQVEGIYKDHQVKLETYQKSEFLKKNGETYTRLSVSFPHKNERSIESIEKPELDVPLTPKDTVSLLTPVEVENKPWKRIRVRRENGGFIYEQRGEMFNTRRLQFLMDWLCIIADTYPMIITLGGKVVPHLVKLAKRDSQLSPLIYQILQDISSETRSRLGNTHQNLFCPKCLTRFSEHKVHLGWWQTIKFYGCRTCQQSQNFYHSWIVSSLNDTMHEEVSRQNGVVRVNWLTRRELFDFDEVEIVHAGDEDVERFAVQVGNDTDPVRKPRYKQIRCVVSAESALSTNTIRILQRMFGSVEVEQSANRVASL